MTDTRDREMKLTAELVRERLWKHAELELLRAGGVQVMFGYTDTAGWLQVGGRTESRVDWDCWWEPGLDTCEEHAAWVAHRLVAELGEGTGHGRASRQEG